MLANQMYPSHVYWPQPYVVYPHYVPPVKLTPPGVCPGCGRCGTCGQPSYPGTNRPIYGSGTNGAVGTSGCTSS